MKNELTHKQAMKFARQIMLPNFDIEKQLKLLSSRALIIGAGGLGCAVAQYLTASGVGNITLVDDDKIEVHNLPRQILYCEQDIGLYKAKASRDLLTQKHPESRVVAICERLRGEALIREIEKHDVVLDCTDNLETRQSLNQQCYSSKVPLVSGAAIRMEGQLFCVLPAKKTACYQCFSQFFNEQQLSCHEAGVMSPIVGIIGNMQALEAIKILSDYGDVLINSLLMFDAMQAQWVKLKVSKAIGCKVCDA